MNQWEIFFLSLFSYCIVLNICIIYVNNRPIVFSTFFCFFLFLFNVVLNVNRLFICSQNVFYYFYTLFKQFEWISMDKAWKWAYKQKKTFRECFFLFGTIDLTNVLLLPSKYNVYFYFGMCTCAMWCVNLLILKWNFWQIFKDNWVYRFSIFFLFWWNCTPKTLQMKSVCNCTAQRTRGRLKTNKDEVRI